MAEIETAVSRRLASVKNIIIVLSGKGGVGKSSSTVQLALSLLSLSPTTRIGLLDLDLTGPSLPLLLGLSGPSHTVHQSSSGWVPVYADQERRLGCMSIGFLLAHRGESVVWRGPKKDGMIRQFLGETRWGELDYLIIDTPPGTSDEHISLLTHLHPLTLPSPLRPPPTFSPPLSILITTPQTTSLNDTLKSLSFTRKLSLPVLGLVENMAGYVCPCCGEVSDVFSKGGGEEMCRREGVDWLGRVPIEGALVKLLDDVVKGKVEVVTPGMVTPVEGVVGESVVETVEEGNGEERKPFPLLDAYQETTSSKIWKEMTLDLLEKMRIRGEAAAAALV